MINILRDRRSARRFDDRKIEEEKIEVLKEALVRSPSSRSINPWEFILIDDQDVLKELSDSKQHGSGFLAGAAMGVVILGDTTKSDTCIEDCSIAAITLQYTAESLDLAGFTSDGPLEAPIRIGGSISKLGEGDPVFALVG